MKQIIYILTFAFLSCNNKTTEKMVDKVSFDTLQSVGKEKPKQDIYIKDKSQYDQTFIDGLNDYNEPIKLIDNFILTGNDTTYFPEDLKVNKRITFTGIKDDSKFILTAKRINLTNITYDFQLIDKENNIIDSKTGNAILGSTFFFAPEGDIDMEMGGYGSYEYWDKSNECRFSVRIGIGTDDNGKQRAKVNYGCTDKSKKTIDLDECPVMRTE